MSGQVENTKPVCGSDKEAGEYDVVIHTVGLCK